MNAQTKIAKNVYQRLNEARVKFHQTELKKSGRNTFANYSYFELGDFLVPALRIFDEVGLCAIVSFTADTATMRIFCAEGPTEEFILITSPMGSAALKGCHEVQNIGAVETYQRRYLWVAALEIVEHDGLEATTGKAGSVDGGAPPKKEVAHSKLKTELRAFVHDMEGCGDWETWIGLREDKNTQRLIAEVRQKLPQWWEGGPDMPEEFVPLHRRIEILEANLAEQKAQYATA